MFPAVRSQLFDINSHGSGIKISKSSNKYYDKYFSRFQKAANTYELEIRS